MSVNFAGEARTNDTMTAQLNDNLPLSQSRYFFPLVKHYLFTVIWPCN